MNTSWYCISCKQWFWLTKRPNKVDALYYHKVRGNESNFVKACFQKSHEAAWHRYYGTGDRGSGESTDTPPDVVAASSSDSSILT